jgi:hypothetical protein
MRKLACVVGTIGERGWRTSDTPDAWNRRPVPGICAAISSGSSPSTRDQFTPAFSNTAPPSRTRATPPPPPGRSHGSVPKVRAPSIVSSRRQMSLCSSRKNADARSKRLDTRSC